MADIDLYQALNILLAAAGSVVGASFAAWKAVQKTVNGKIDHLEGKVDSIDTKNEKHFQDAKEERRMLRTTVEGMRTRLQDVGERVAVMWHERDDGFQ